MEGNVGVEGESLRAPRMNRDNGFAMASGQPAKRAFPKEMPAFCWGYPRESILTAMHLRISRLPNLSHAMVLAAGLAAMKKAGVPGL
jgi:hypothetical protein